jgi:hypothetical protein
VGHGLEAGETLRTRTGGKLSRNRDHDTQQKTAMSPSDSRHAIGVGTAQDGGRLHSDCSLEPPPTTRVPSLCTRRGELPFSHTGSVIGSATELVAGTTVEAGMGRLHAPGPLTAAARPRSTTTSGDGFSTRSVENFFFWERPIPPAPSGEGVAGEQLRSALGQQQQPNDDGEERRRDAAAGGAGHGIVSA